MSGVPLEVALSLGSNLGDRRAHLARALRRIEEGLLDELRISSLYVTAPLGVTGDQPEYLNLCVLGRSPRRPLALLAGCQALEAEAGRDRKGLRLPRTLDIDLLFVGQEIRYTQELDLPHPGMAERRFVLEPLAELAPHWCHPETGLDVSAMLAASDPRQAVRRLETPKGWWRLEQTC